jgi:hypothetical protein
LTCSLASLTTQDALGGNSQTLFLACVSPAESNESESYSTLSVCSRFPSLSSSPTFTSSFARQYARQARNIKNKPVRNMDRQQLELRRLRYQAKAWMTKAIIQMAQSGQELNLAEIDNLMTHLSSDLDNNSEVFQRPDVQQYISTVNEVSQLSPLCLCDSFTPCRKSTRWFSEELNPLLGSIGCPSSLLGFEEVLERRRRADPMPPSRRSCSSMVRIRVLVLLEQRTLRVRDSVKRGLSLGSRKMTTMSWTCNLQRRLRSWFPE